MKRCACTVLLALCALNILRIQGSSEFQVLNHGQKRSFRHRAEMEMRSDDQCSIFDNIMAGWKGGLNRVLCDLETQAVTTVVNKGGDLLMKELKQLNKEICVGLGVEVEGVAQPLIAEASAFATFFAAEVAVALEATLAAIDAAVVTACKQLLEKIEKQIIDAIEKDVINALIQGLPGCDAVHCPNKTPLDAYETCSGWCHGCQCKSGVCARQWSNNDDSLACCPTKDWQNDWAAAYCTNLEPGKKCFHDYQCETYLCHDKTCVTQRRMDVTCQQIRDGQFEDIQRHGCDISHIKYPNGKTPATYDTSTGTSTAGITHCYRDECDPENNRDYMIRAECACKGMYFDSNWHDCGDWYFAGYCKTYSEDDSLLQLEGGKQRTSQHTKNNWYKEGVHPEYYKFFELLYNARKYPGIKRRFFSDKEELPGAGYGDAPSTAGATDMEVAL